MCAAFKLGLSPDEIAQRLGQYDANYWQAQRATVWPIIEGDCDDEGLPTPTDEADDGDSRAPGWAPEEKTPAMKTIIIGNGRWRSSSSTARNAGRTRRLHRRDAVSGSGADALHTGPELDYLSELDRFHIPYTDSPAAATTGHTLCELELNASTTRVQDNWDSLAHPEPSGGGEDGRRRAPVPMTRTITVVAAALITVILNAGIAHADPTPPPTPDYTWECDTDSPAIRPVTRNRSRTAACPRTGSGL